MYFQKCKEIKMDIFSYINNGADYIVWENTFVSFDKYINKGEKEYILLVPNSRLMERESIARLFSEYYIHELFDLSNCYMGTANARYVLWHIKKDQPQNVKIANFYGYAHPYRDNEVCEKRLKIPDKYEDNYKKYIRIIENWKDQNVAPKNADKGYEIITLPWQEFDITRPYPRYYRKDNAMIRKQLSEAEMANLSDVAEIILTRALDGENNVTKVKALNPYKVPGYPYIPELCAVESNISSQKVHKGDIVELKNEYLLIDKESTFDLYAPAGTRIIRAKKLSPEYLYFYLNSRTARKIRDVLRIPISDGVSTYLNGGSIFDSQVLMPTKDPEFYIQEFLKVSTPYIRYYEKNSNEEPKSLEDILSAELAEKIQMNGRELVKKQIDEDIVELNTCFKNGAYKATLILAGSIMEAILIDWLSELRGIDYFQEQLKIKRRKKKTGLLEEVDADLAGYINEIKEIKKPAWMQESFEAHEIREKRNLVHAKLCLKEKEKIDETMCRTIIEYLKNIIDSRWQ